jgi:hypothetical protein
VGVLLYIISCVHGADDDGPAHNILHDGVKNFILTLRPVLRRLEAMNDTRQGLVTRLKITEREKEALEGRKAEAELFIAKQVIHVTVLV